MATDRITTEVEGAVTQVNGNGFKLEGWESWLNVSKWAEPAPLLPHKDELVRVGLDKGGYVRAITIVEDSKGFPAEAHNRWQDTSGQNAPEAAQVDRGARDRAKPSPNASAQTNGRSDATGEPVDRLTRITRLACLNTATAILSAGGGVAPVDEVLSIAAELEAWVTR